MKFQVVEVDYTCYFCLTSIKTSRIYVIHGSEATRPVPICENCLLELRKAINKIIEEMEK